MKAFLQRFVDYVRERETERDASVRELTWSNPVS